MIEHDSVDNMPALVDSLISFYIRFESVKLRRRIAPIIDGVLIDCLSLVLTTDSM